MASLCPFFFDTPLAELRLSQALPLRIFAPLRKINKIRAEWITFAKEYSTIVLVKPILHAPDPAIRLGFSLLFNRGRRDIQD